MLNNNTNARYAINFANKFEDGTWVFETLGVFDNLDLAQAFLTHKFDELIKSENVLAFEKEEDEKWGLYRITGTKQNTLKCDFELFCQSI